MITELILKSNINYHKEYTKVSQLLGNKLDNYLKEIVRFYYSDFWASRFKRRLREENRKYYTLELDCILGTISYLREDTKFKLFDEGTDLNGRSDNGTMIALNVNMNDENLNDSHIKNIVMHEFGHRQYNQPLFDIVRYLNKLLIEVPGTHIKNNQTLGEKDYLYFTDDNELRQRIIPIVKEMYDNDWSAEEAYNLSENLLKDDIKDIFTKDYIINLLKNIL